MSHSTHLKMKGFFLVVPLYHKDVVWIKVLELCLTKKERMGRDSFSSSRGRGTHLLFSCDQARLFNMQCCVRVTKSLLPPSLSGTHQGFFTLKTWEIYPFRYPLNNFKCVLHICETSWKCNKFRNVGFLLRKNLRENHDTTQFNLYTLVRMSELE